jgi:transcriptional regulator with XRE-family HTH domain
MRVSNRRHRDDNEATVSRDIQDEERQRRFARNLRAARHRARLTQAGIAELLGMGDEVYARYERAKMWPSLDKLCRLCDILDCTADALLGLDEPPPTPVEAPPPEDPQPVRRLMRQLRKSRPRTVRLVGRMLSDLESCSKSLPGDKDGKELTSAEDDGDDERFEDVEDTEGFEDDES